uniref:polymorphic toxin-type HINT domain-containing protein n=1 Tax=Moraxella oblonga TaxID=200413 RepID=UPI00082C2E4B
DEAFDVNELKLETKHNAGFVAGTLVHTNKGLVPIQDIKVGDMVLSRDEFNPQGDLQYKPVLSTFKSQQKERIYKVEYPTNDGMEYIFCNALHPFWSAYDPSGKTGKWEAAEDLSGTFLVNLSGETFGLDNVPFMPVRTLPNYPEGCAYVQFVEDPDFWENGGGLIEFVKFDSNGYQFISLADNEEAFDEEIKTLNYKTLDAKLRLTPKANFLVDKELYKTLNVRLYQDINAKTHTAQKFIEAMNKPLIFEGKIVRENSIADEELYRKALKNIETYGDATGLTEMSLHEAMISLDMPAPNPYEDFVYNLEVDGNHTYFVGHDGIWVHNCDTK